MSTLLVIRHAQSTMNASGLWQGQADPPLSAWGRRQAERLAAALAHVGIRRLVASDLRRARETADILARVLVCPLELDPDLREMDVGVWSGRPHAEIAQRWPRAHARLRAGDWDVRPPGGETRREVRARAERALRRHLAGSTSSGALAVVTHLGVLRALVSETRLENAEFVPTPGAGTGGARRRGASSPGALEGPL